MLCTVRGLVNISRNCVVELVNADSIMDDVIKITKDSKVAVVFKII